MTFEEFFRKKRIDLMALKAAEPSLFFEFQAHYQEMGEKSFDHTKKYWFNKLRREYQLAPEVKTEKVHIANPLAEQTITESLTETVARTATPKPGFVPKFKAGSMPKPVTKQPEPDQEREAALQNPEPPVNEGEVPPNKGYQPRFKMKPKMEGTESVPPSLPAEPNDTLPGEHQQSEQAAQSPVQEKSPKPAYQPRFKMKPKVDGNQPADLPEQPQTEHTTPSLTADQQQPAEIAPATPDDTLPKPAYKPRFNMKNIKPKEGE